MKLLFIRFSALGDVILTTGVIKHIKQQFPEAEIHFLTHAPFQLILSRLDFIDKVHFVDSKLAKKQRIEFYKNMPSYDYVFDLHGVSKSQIFKWATNNKKVYTYKKQSLQRRLYTKFGWCKKSLNKHVIEKYADCCFGALNVSAPRLEEIRPQITAEVLSNEQIINSLPAEFILLHPFASQSNKVWPHVSSLCTKLLAEGYKVVVVGVGDIDLPKDVIDLTNKTNLSELISVTSKAKAVITTDSGPLHIAVALNKKVISIMGPTTKEFGFFPLFINCKVVENENLSCRPCHVHGGNQCPLGHFKCMNDISADKVYNTFKDLLHTRP